MKKGLLILALLVCSVSLFAQKPTVKIYLNDATAKTYNIEDIDNIGVIKNQPGFILKIYRQDSLNSSIPTSNIDFIKFESVNNTIINMVINLIDVSTKTFVLSDIDSIVFIPILGPVITNIDPSSTKIGDEVTLTGTGFGATQGTSYVSFNGIKAASYSSWDDNQIVVKVPVAVVTGKISVTVNTVKSNEVDFTIIISPNIKNISPTSFGVGDVVTINGTNFGATQGSSIVTFNNADATSITSWSNTKIVCKAPLEAQTGELFLTVNSVQSNFVNFTITSTVEAVLVPSGTFQMGNTGTYSGLTMIQEIPVHQVTISHSFYMSKFEIQQWLYISVMGKNPSNFKGKDLPVERINFYDAVSFCNKLSDRDGLTNCYTINGTNVTCDWTANGWRLPTEAEWEYACKAGTSTDFYSGNNETDLAQVAWYSGNSNDSTHISGLKKANKFGLYDMLGNVFEWVWDWSGSYNAGAVTDPTGPSSGTIKIMRGGSWHQGMVNGMSRSSFRGWMDTPSLWSSTNGIRVIRINL